MKACWYIILIDIRIISSWISKKLESQNIELYEIGESFPPGVVCTHGQEPTPGGLCIVK